jgi:hypothetical protein
MVHASAVRFDPPDILCHRIAPFTMIRVAWESIALVTDRLNYVNYDTEAPETGPIAMQDSSLIPISYDMGKQEGKRDRNRKQYMPQMTYVVDITTHSAK